MTPRQPPAAGPFRRGFTLIELLVVIGIILVLVAILLPVVGLIRAKAIAASTRATVAALGIAMKAYADEDPRHFYPTPRPASEQLVYDLADPNCALMQLEHSGYQVPPAEIDNLPGSPTRHVLMDGWWRPLHYRLDGPFLNAGVIDTTAMNGAADRPAPLATDWNPRSVEPFAYVWSLGKPTGTDSDDALPASYARWIYQQGTP